VCAAAVGGGGDFLTGFPHRLVFDDADAFRFAFGPLDFRFGQQDAFGDVLPGDLIAVRAADAARWACRGVVRPGQFPVASGAVRGCAPWWAHHDFQFGFGGGVSQRGNCAAPG
jgi:hypothetical protein